MELEVVSVSVCEPPDASQDQPVMVFAKADVVTIDDAIVTPKTQVKIARFMGLFLGYMGVKIRSATHRPYL